MDIPTEGEFGWTSFKGRHGSCPVSEMGERHVLLRQELFQCLYSLFDFTVVLWVARTAVTCENPHAVTKSLNFLHQ